MDDSNAQSPLSGSRAVAVYALIALVFSAIMLSIGDPSNGINKGISVLFIVLNSAWLPGIYLLGALGLGSIARRWTKSIPSQWVIELGIGLTITLTLSHGLGVLGWLNPISAWIITAGGIGLLIPSLSHRTQSLNTIIGKTTLSVSGMCCVLGCTLAVLMSTNPPGTSWDSEFGGYDALSYHLELPREWLEAGRITPSEHNVYSFLPSSIESAYLHFAYLADAPKTDSAGLSGMLANDARVLMATQMFSAMLLIVSVLAISCVARRAIKILIPDAHSDDESPALCAQALMSCTPWLVAVGSLAYNEMGVVLLGICAFAAAVERDRSITSRTVICALIVGGACCCKPTALFLFAPSIGVILLATIPPKQWWKPIALGSVVGLITISPWLVRNEMAAGNVVFPQLSSALGDGHWTDAQHAIYASAHHFEGGLIDRFLMLFMPDANGTQHVSRYRGLSNVQWAVLPWAGLLGCCVLMVQQRTRKLGLAVSLAIALPIVCWMLLTHLQSRFLVPIAPMGIGACALGLASIRPSSIRRFASSAISFVSLAFLILVTASQSGGSPFSILDLGVGVYTGELEITNPPWTSTLNQITDPNETVYLLGDATPIYVRSPMVYNTVYDRWLIEESISRYPNQPAQWSVGLKQQGIDVVVISFSEINRFAVSGWLPKSIAPDMLGEWIETLPEPIYVWTHPSDGSPIRAAFRLTPLPNRSEPIKPEP